MMDKGYFFVSGGMLVAYLTISLFFLKFWKKTNDRFFGFFSISFFLLGIERLILVVLTQPTEADATIYLIRLFAFLLIVVAIVYKNR